MSERDRSTNGVSRDVADRHFWEIQPIRDVLILLAVLWVLWIGYLASLVTVPLLLAMLLAYLFEPLVQWLTKSRHFSREGAAAMIIAVASFIVLVPLSGVLWLGVTQGLGLINAVTGNVAEMQRYVEADVDTERELRELRPEGAWGEIAEFVREFEQLRDEEVDETDGGGDEGAESVSAAAAVVADVDEDEGDGVDGEGEARGEEGAQARADDADAEADADAAALAAAEAQRAAAEEERRQRKRAQAILIYPLYQSVTDWTQENRARLGQQVLGRGFDVAQFVVGTLSSAGFIAFQVFLTAFFFFFVCTGWGAVLRFWESLIPQRKKGEAIDLLRKMDRVIAGFVRGRLTIMVIQCFVFSLGYYAIGVPAAILVGIGVGVLSVVPYLALLGIPVSVGLMFLAGPEEGLRSAWWWMIGAPIGFYFAAQALDDYVWTPVIQGKSTDLDTPTVLFASIAGGALAGVYGLLIAIPVAACLKIIIREVLWPRLMAWAAGEKPDPLPIGRSPGESGD